MIEVKNLTKSYAQNNILENVSATINNGDVIAVIGPSGCGKSTFLNCACMLEEPTEGQIIYDGTDLTAPGINLNEFRKKIGVVFQSFNLFGHMTVLENVMYPQLDLLKTSPQDAYDKAMEYLCLVGLADKKWSYPHQLSGGQKQRVAIARTLSMEPEVIFFDEPTSALDPTMVGEVEYVIKRLAEQGRTMIIVTHEMRFAKEVSNRVFYLDEKGIYEDGPTKQIFTAPQKEKTRRFIKNLKSLEININSAGFDHVGAIDSIRNYGERLAMPIERIYKAQLLFEEFCVQCLIPSLGPNPKARVVFEFDSATDKLSMNVSHGGKPIAGDLPEISDKIVQGLQSVVALNEICDPNYI